MRWINRAATAAIAVVIVVGPPLAAAVWIQTDHWRFPAAAEVPTWIEQPPSGIAVAALIGSIAIIMWLLLVFAIVQRTWHTLSGTVRRLRRTPLPTAAQMTAGSMAGVAALALPSIAVDHPGAAAPASAPAGPELAGPEQATVQAGIDLPGGGWVPYRTALAVTVLSGAIWLHRRQHYQPEGPRFGEHRRDADLQPLPGSAEALIASVDDQPPQDLTPGSTLPELPTGLLTLHGPGAMNAARGLLITTILGTALASSPPTSSPPTAVVLRASDLEFLLGVRICGDLPPGLHTDDAVTLDTLGLSGVDDDHVGQPMLVIRQPGHTSHPGRTVERVGNGTDAATVVVVGDDVHEGRHWYVAADGNVTGDDVVGVQRLCLLDVHAAKDLLMLVQGHAGTASSAQAEPVRPLEHPTPRPGELRMLGGCRLRANGNAVHIRRSAGLQILAYLAVHPEGASTTDLIRAVWPGLDPNTITKRLHTTLTDLRQQLHPILDDAIVRLDERYRLNPDMIETDLDQLRRAITAAATAVTGPQRESAARAIIDAYRGDLAAGFSWPWLQPMREALRRDVIDAYLQLAASAPQVEALDLVRSAIAADPYNEALHDEAQRILTAIGEHDAAQALRHGLHQRLVSAGLRPATANTDSPRTPGR